MLVLVIPETSNTSEIMSVTSFREEIKTGEKEIQAPL